MRYYTFSNYSDEAMQNKKDILRNFLKKLMPKTCWDMGANNGFFTRIASEKNIQSVAFDIDPIAVEKNYLQIKDKNKKNLLPLIMDLTNPSPSIGWNCQERDSLTSRNKVDVAMGLALVQHLAISKTYLNHMQSFSNISNLIIGIFTQSRLKFKSSYEREDIFKDIKIGFEKDSGNILIN